MKKRDITQRVVITGMGALTPLGLSVQETWEGLVAGRASIESIKESWESIKREERAACDFSPHTRQWCAARRGRTESSGSPHPGG